MAAATRVLQQANRQAPGPPGTPPPPCPCCSRPFLGLGSDWQGIKIIALEHAFPSSSEQAPAAGKPAPPGPGQAKSRDIMPDIGYNIHDIGTFTDTISDTKMTRCRVDVMPISVYTRYRVYPISVYCDIDTDIGVHRYR